MSQLTTEQKFQQLRKQLKPQDFNSIEFLSAKAEQIESEDADLAKRILVRVSNLKKQTETKSEKLDVPREKHEIKLATKKAEPEPKKRIQKIERMKLWRPSFLTLAILPTILFAFYQCFWATERFESQAQVIVQQPDGMATMDTSMALLSGLGVSSSSASDTELVKAYILSNDMLKYLEEKLKLREHYSQTQIDVFSRMGAEDSWEKYLEYYQNHIEVYVDAKSGIVHVYSQAFTPEFAHKLTQTIVKRAEWFINSIGHQLAEAQLAFIKHEHENIESKLEEAQSSLLNFQQKYNLLDPTAEGAAMQQITYGLEGQITAKETELKNLLTVMSEQAPQVISARNTLAALNLQLVKERSKLSDDSGNNIPVSEILSRYTDLKVKMELALSAYTASQVSLEKSRIEAYRQLKYLVIVESAIHPQENKYPNVFYNVSLFFVIIAMLYFIAKIVISVVKELK